MGLLSIFGGTDRNSASRRQRRAFSPSLHPSCEALEDRVVLSHAGAEVAVAPQQVVGSANFNIETINVNPTDLVLGEDGVLRLVEGAVASVSGTLAGLPFTADITNFALQLIPGGGGGGGGGGQSGACSVLDLALGPIDVDLLGLNVNTSEICLNITAYEGQGLLGSLLCGLAGGNLGLLGSGDLTDGLSTILTDALGRAGAVDATNPLVEDICDGECEVLDLAVGPVSLDLRGLLGVTVLLDDCEGGPVQVCVSASAGEGLLGDLLCGLAGGGLLPNLGDLEGIIGGLDDILDDLDGLNVPQKQLDKLVDQATRILRDGDVTSNEIAQLTRSIAKLVRKA